MFSILLVWNDSDCEKYAEAMKSDKHYTFAEKLRDALRHSDTHYTESTEDSYAVDISISGSRTDADEGIRYVSFTILLMIYLKLISIIERIFEIPGLNVVVAAVLFSTTIHWMKVFLWNRLTKVRIGSKNMKINFRMVSIWMWFNAAQK